MQNTILIFGGGENQLTLIKAARALGVRSIVIDPNQEAPGRAIADHFEVVEPSDYSLTREIAINHKVNGIVTSQMENPLILMANLAEDLGFIFPSLEVIKCCRNKYLMKQVFLNNNIPCSRGILIKSDIKIESVILKDFSFPIIIKPVDSHSSRGVFKVENYEGLKKFEAQTRCFSSDQSILIEEFIEGKEYSVETLTYKGKTFVIQITEKIITPYPCTVETGHIQPAELTDEEKLAIEKTVIKTISALGIDNSAAHTELKFTNRGPIIIEIGARLGGDFISSYLTFTSTGINMDEGAINIAIGHNPDVDKKYNKFSFIKYLELPEGMIVKKVNNWKDIRNNPDVIHALLSIKEGDVIPAMTNSAKRTGFVMVRGKTRDEVINNANKAIRILSEKIQFD
jgi:carbamoyl-phosphate synthase large subunit